MVLKKLSDQIHEHGELPQASPPAFDVVSAETPAAHTYGSTDVPAVIRLDAPKNRDDGFATGAGLPYFQLAVEIGLDLRERGRFRGWVVLGVVNCIFAAALSTFCRDVRPSICRLHRFRRGEVEFVCELALGNLDGNLPRYRRSLGPRSINGVVKY